MVHPGLLPMSALDRIPSLRGHFRLTLRQPLNGSHHGRPQNELHRRYQLSHPSGLAPQSPTNFRFLQFHPFPPLMVQLQPYQQILLSNPFRRELPPIPNHPRTRLGDLKLTSSNGSYNSISSWHTVPTTHHEIRFLMSVRRMCKLPRRLRSCARSHLP